MKKILFLLLFIAAFSYGQSPAPTNNQYGTRTPFIIPQTASGKIGFGTKGPEASFDFDSTSGGFLFPRMTTTQRNLIPTPSTSTIIRNITTNQFEYYNGTTWVAFSTTLTSNQLSAIQNANSPTAGNPFATINDTHNYIPLSGTVSGSPVTGTIQLTDSGHDVYLQTDALVITDTPGNYTSVPAGSVEIGDSAGRTININPSVGLQMTDGFVGALKMDNITANRNYQTPDASGTFGVSVNGVPFDSNGDVTISTGGISTVVAGANIVVDATDPINPIVKTDTDVNFETVTTVNLITGGGDVHIKDVPDGDDVYYFGKNGNFTLGNVFGTGIDVDQATSTINFTSSSLKYNGNELATQGFVGANYQPSDSDLTTISAQGNTSFGLGLLAQPSASSLRALIGAGTGNGTVTSTSVVSANGFAGSVATATTTPAVTISTTVTGILKGNGTAISAAVAADFPTLNQNTTGNAATVTTNANLTGAVTSTGNATSLGSFTSANLSTAVSDETGTGSAVFNTSPTFVTPILGTPTSATLTNATGLPISTGVSGLATGIASFLATPSSSNLAAAITDETGSAGNVVFSNTPTITTPTIAAINGGTAANDDITIQGTTNSTRTTSYVNLQPSGGFVGIGTTTPAFPLEVVGGTNLVPFSVSYSGNDGGIASMNLGTLAANRTAQLRLVNGPTVFGVNDRTYQFVNVGTSSTAADLYFQYWNGSSYNERLRIASNGNVGVNNSAPSSTLQVTGSFAPNYTAVSSTYTALSTDYTIDCTSGTFTVTLPTAVGIKGRIYPVKNSGAGTITIATTSSQTIDGVTTKTLNVQYGGLILQSDNANWKIIGTF